MNNDIQEKLKTGVEKAFEDLKPYLNMMAKQYQYSIRNTILICAANPNASIVGGYQKLLKEYDHQVKKGEAAIQILAPTTCSTTSDTFINRLKNDINKYGIYTIGTYVFFKKDDEITVKGKGLNNIVVSDLKNFLLKNVGETAVVGFKGVNVFDISQTAPILDKEGKPTPKAQKLIDTINVKEIAPVKDGDFQQVVRLFNACSQSSNAMHLDIRDILGNNTKGYFNILSNAIVINDKNTYTQSLKTLIHEEAHCRLHVDSKESRFDAEIQAEATAYVVTQHYGIDTGGYSFEYVADWSKNKEIGDLIKNLEIISKTSTEIIKEMDEQLEITKEMSLEEIINENDSMRCDMFLKPLHDIKEAELLMEENEQDLEI